MEDALKDAIKYLAEQVKDGVKSDDAMRFSQAALNLAHVLETFDAMTRRP